MSTIEEVKLQEHLYKETLMGIVRESQNYSDEIKQNVISTTFFLPVLNPCSIMKQVL